MHALHMASAMYQHWEDDSLLRASGSTRTPPRKGLVLPLGIGNCKLLPRDRLINRSLQEIGKSSRDILACVKQAEIRISSTWKNGNTVLLG